MLKALTAIHPMLLLLMATLLEASGDAVIRRGLYEQVGAARIALIAGGGVLLLCYGSFLNLTPLDFGRVVGLYIATLFVVWQLINYLVFHAVPTLPTLVGGALIVGGGAIVTYWTPAR
jgi:small multidrug resistance family-3 protein